MDDDYPSELGEEEAEAYVGGICFKTGPPRRTGVELEWLVHDARDPALPVPAERLDAALAPLEPGSGAHGPEPAPEHHVPERSGPPSGLPHGGTLTREPGGQVELSSLPASSLADCLANTASDLAVLRRTLAASGLVLEGRGLEPRRNPSRVLDHPRYQAMERYFDRRGPWGRLMMRATASVQVSLDAGDDSDGISGYRQRWRLAHRLGPVLLAAFANSPLWQGRPTGWVSGRQAIWFRMDPGRTRPPRSYGDDPRVAWTRYALDADLLCLRQAAPRAWTAPPDLTFRSWLRGAREPQRQPTVADLDYHLSTLFPPVRARGWLELRMIDAQPDDGWMVATAVAATLLDDPMAAETARRATERLCLSDGAAADGAPLTEPPSAETPSAETPSGRISPDGAEPVSWRGPATRPGTPDEALDSGLLPPPEIWLRAARHGPADPLLGPVVRRCFDAVREALARRGESPELRAAVDEFVRRYPSQGRCPAHDQLDAFGPPGPPGPPVPGGAPSAPSAFNHLDHPDHPDHPDHLDECDRWASPGPTDGTASKPREGAR